MSDEACLASTFIKRGKTICPRVWWVGKFMTPKSGKSLVHAFNIARVLLSGEGHMIPIFHENLVTLLFDKSYVVEAAMINKLVFFETIHWMFG